MHELGQVGGKHKARSRGRLRTFSLLIVISFHRALELTLKNNLDPNGIHDLRQEFLDTFGVEEFLDPYTELASFIKRQGQSPSTSQVGPKHQAEGQQRKKEEAIKDEIEEMIEETED